MSADKNPFLKETEELRSLRVLREIEKDPSVSQRELADTLGVALGIANACIRTLVRKGMIKVRGENNRSMTYHLTKKGFAQKASLAAQWTVNTIGFYREMREIIGAGLQVVASSGTSHIVILGVNEIAELVALLAPSAGLEVVGVVAQENTFAEGCLAGAPLVEVESLGGVDPDAVLLCLESQDPQREGLYKEVLARLPGVPIFWIDGSELDVMVTPS
ncbi:MAG: winged helix-turn-helix transcriptional regulator [Deltaproteobacteria bacterium]|nr:winged helix-turn-helix transcriptional regulator [Deltaproteobacteria bacterium]